MIIPMLAKDFQIYLYVYGTERMPDNAPDEWFLFGHSDIPFSIEECEDFLNGVFPLVDKVSTMHENTSEEIQFEFYEAAKRAFGDEKNSIRKFFKMFYLLMFARDSGPRWGEFVKLTGIDVFVTRFYQRVAQVPF